MITRQPACASRIADAVPAGPAPSTRTSQSKFIYAPLRLSGTKPRLRTSRGETMTERRCRKFYKVPIAAGRVPRGRQFPIRKSGGDALDGVSSRDLARTEQGDQAAAD